MRGAEFNVGSFLKSNISRTAPVPELMFLRTPHPALRTQAFTLLEVLLALSILAIMGTMIFGSFRSLVDATTRAESAMDELHVVETLANRIGDSLRAAAWYASDPERYEFRHESGVGSPPRDTLSWVTHAPPFTTGGLPGLVRVELTVDDPDGEDALVMKSFSCLWEEDAPEVEDIEAVEITRRVNGLKIWCYDAQEQEWVEEWERERQLPISVALILTLTPDEGERNGRTVVRRIDLPLAALSRATTRGRRRIQDPSTRSTTPVSPPAPSGNSITIEAPR